MKQSTGSAGSAPTAIGPTWVAYCLMPASAPSSATGTELQRDSYKNRQTVELALTTPEQATHEVGHVAQAAAEEKAAASAKEGLARRAREAEAAAQALAENVEELRLTLDRQRASAELR